MTRNRYSTGDRVQVHYGATHLHLSRNRMALCCPHCGGTGTVVKRMPGDWGPRYLVALDGGERATFPGNVLRPAK